MKERWIMPAMLIGILALLVPQRGGCATVPFTPPFLSPGDEYQIVFVTEGGRDALSSNIQDYNAFVQAEAERPGALTASWAVQWNAIASTPEVDARDNAPVTVPLFALDGTFVALGAPDLWDGSLTGRIWHTQFGPRVPDRTVWTGSIPNGLGANGYELGSEMVRTGNSFFGNSFWLSTRDISTVQLSPDQPPILVEHALYAVSEILTVVPEPDSLGGFIVVGVIVGSRRNRLN